MSSFNDIANTVDAGTSGDDYDYDYDFGLDGTLLNGPNHVNDAFFDDIFAPAPTDLNFNDTVLFNDAFSNDIFNPAPIDVSFNLDTTPLPSGNTITPGLIDFSNFIAYDDLAPVPDDYSVPITDDYSVPITDDYSAPVSDNYPAPDTDDFSVAVPCGDSQSYAAAPEPYQSPREPTPERFVVVEQPDTTPDVSASLPTVDYVPLIPLEPEDPVEEPLSPLYPAFQNKFQTGEAAKAHRKKERSQRKPDPRVEFVRKHGREFWVRRIYKSIIAIDDLEDGDKSTHFTRFVKKKTFDADDLEATAHHVFDKACAVHERGWSRYKTYHKPAVRGALVDQSKNSIELRLQRICQLLRKNKSLCNDALQGGLTLAQLCDNPYARAGTKEQNNRGNRVRGERLQAGRNVLEKKKTDSQAETPSSPSPGGGDDQVPLLD